MQGVRLSDVNTRRMSGLKYKLVVDMVEDGISECMMWMDQHS